MMRADRTKLPALGPEPRFTFPEIRRSRLANGVRVCTRPLILRWRAPLESNAIETKDKMISLEPQIKVYSKRMRNYLMRKFGHILLCY